MRDAVASVGADVADDAVAARHQAGLLGDALGGLGQASEQGSVLWPQRPEVLDVALGDDQGVNWRLRGEIDKGERLVILGADLCRRPTGDDLTKGARAQRTSRRRVSRQLSWRREGGAARRPRPARRSGRFSTAR